MGVDDVYTAKRADSRVDVADDWDDNVPIWASTAQDVPGVEILDTNQPVKKFSKSAFTKPAFGFSVATNLSNSGGWHHESNSNPKVCVMNQPRWESELLNSILIHYLPP